MAVSGDLYNFSDSNIGLSPTDNGVYSPQEDGVTIYIGKGDGENGIRARLQAHKRGDEGSCTQSATAYRREVCRYPLSRETELLEEYKQNNGRLPRCNERIG